ncbi:hypothetical protein C8R47DRAFT_1085431 [Mycena vitilis]|nr:hypothetical protein C8R47DRAFT_1085431 [Mycena vitilis]
MPSRIQVQQRQTQWHCRNDVQTILPCSNRTPERNKIFKAESMTITIKGSPIQHLSNDLVFRVSVVTVCVCLRLHCPPADEIFEASAVDFGQRARGTRSRALWRSFTPAPATDFLQFLSENQGWDSSRMGARVEDKIGHLILGSSDLEQMLSRWVARAARARKLVYNFILYCT